MICVECGAPQEFNLCLECNNKYLESCMDADKPSFVLDDVSDNHKPLPYTLGNPKSKKEKIIQIDHYPKFEIEFFDTVKDCAVYIDRLSNVDLRIMYTKRLNKIFVLRDKMLCMRLFRELATKEIQ